MIFFDNETRSPSWNVPGPDATEKTAKARIRSFSWREEKSLNIDLLLIFTRRRCEHRLFTPYIHLQLVRIDPASPSRPSTVAFGASFRVYTSSVASFHISAGFLSGFTVESLATKHSHLCHFQLVFPSIWQKDFTFWNLIQRCLRVSQDNCKYLTVLKESDVSKQKDRAQRKTVECFRRILQFDGESALKPLAQNKTTTKQQHNCRVQEHFLQTQRKKT